MNIKFIALSVLLAHCELAFAGFDVVNNYEYHGGYSNLIKTSPSVSYPAPVQRPLTVVQPMVNNQREPVAPGAHVLNDADVQKLINSLSNISFIGKPDARVFSSLQYSDSGYKLEKGIQLLAAGKYRVIIYPSVAKSFGDKLISWQKGDVWVTALDKAIDAYPIKVSIDVGAGSLYVSGKNDTKSFIENTTTKQPATSVIAPRPVAIQPAVITPTPKSPFKVDNTSSGKNIAPPVAIANVTAPVPDKPVINMKPIIMGSWSAVAGITLRKQMQIWADKQGWKLVWQTDKDYPLSAGFTVHGKDSGDVGYMEAMKEAFSLYDQAAFPFSVQAYPEQKLLYVTTKGKSGNA